VKRSKGDTGEKYRSLEVVASTASVGAGFVLAIVGLVGALSLSSKGILGLVITVAVSTPIALGIWYVRAASK
jgi:hypothetical protein